MKKMIQIAVLVVLSCASILAQRPTAPGGKGQPKMQNMEKMRVMHEEMMKDMQADIDSMKSTVTQMKAQLPKISDASVHQQLQWNVDLWQKMLDDMDKHMSMMKQMMESHGDMMMRHDTMMKGGSKTQESSPK